MLLKLNLSKAFDKLNWVFIEKTLSSFRFHPSWTHWVTHLISSFNSSIILNGVPSKPFKPYWGIRQGDPLSPFIFILMSEGIGRMLNHAKNLISLNT